MALLVLVLLAVRVPREEVAITRNASESLEILQLGFDLQRGDLVLASDQDYPRMLTAFRQRQRREGLRLQLIELPHPCDDPAEIVACVQVLRAELPAGGGAGAHLQRVLSATDAADERLAGAAGFVHARRAAMRPSRPTPEVTGGDEPKHSA